MKTTVSKKFVRICGDFVTLHGYIKLYLHQKEKQKLELFGKKILKIFEPQTDELTGGGRNLYVQGIMHVLGVEYHADQTQEWSGKFNFGPYWSTYFT
jgi:hypothetical protein